MIVLPGGAFHLLSMQNEGHDLARHLVDRGIAAHVCKYRVVPTPPDDEGFHAAPPDAPPLFLAAAEDDAIVGIAGTLRLHDLWRAADRPVELHLYEQGGHGFGMLCRGLPVDRWTDAFVDWLGSRAE